MALCIGFVRDMGALQRALVKDGSSNHSKLELAPPEMNHKKRIRARENANRGRRGVCKGGTGGGKIGG